MVGKGPFDQRAARSGDKRDRSAIAQQTGFAQVARRGQPVMHRAPGVDGGQPPRLVDTTSTVSIPLRRKTGHLPQATARSAPRCDASPEGPEVA